MAKNNKKRVLVCKLEVPKLEEIEPLKIDCPDIKIELEDIKIDTPDIKLPNLTIKATSKRVEFIELLESITGFVFEVIDKKIIEEGARNKKDKETMKMLKKYDEMRKKHYKKIKGG